jgi:DNA mismatch repair protein MSH2
LKNLNQEFTDLQEKYERKQSGLAKEVVTIAGKINRANTHEHSLTSISVASYADTLEGLNGTIAHLDVIHRYADSHLSFLNYSRLIRCRIISFAHVACYAPTAYIKPKVVNKGQGDLLLKDSRHPCLETLPDINFIPNDVDMKRENSDFQIITGANTGGKSVYLRQVRSISSMGA